MRTHDFLLELGTEELPPKLLLKLSKSLKDNISEELTKLNISFTSITPFTTPRRLAVVIANLQGVQKDQVIEKKAPLQSHLKWLSKALLNRAVLN